MRTQLSSSHSVIVNASCSLQRFVALNYVQFTRVRVFVVRFVSTRVIILERGKETFQKGLRARQSDSF